jgi:hypothetical protein
MDGDFMREYTVEAKSCEDFIRRYHVRDGMYLRDLAFLVKAGKEEVEKYGYILLPSHISVTGEMVSWFPKKQGQRGMKKLEAIDEKGN